MKLPEFGIIILDTAPIGIASDSLNIVKNVDASLLVAMAKKTKLGALTKIYNDIEDMKSSGGNVSKLGKRLETILEMLLNLCSSTTS